MFAAFNVVSWQCIVGSVLVLFARKIGMPPSWVGFLLSFIPFSMLLVVLTVPLVTRVGPKRLMLVTWMMRNGISCIIFLMPWAMTHWGPKSAWYVLMAATLGFCIMRSLGVGGWFPWLHEVVPDGQRGAFFSAETSVANLMSIAVVAGQALVLYNNPSLNQFLYIYAVGIVGGALSLAWMVRVPGGLAVDRTETNHSSRAAYHAAMADRPFLWVVLIASLCMVSMSFLGSVFVMYLRDILKLSDRTILVLTAIACTGILLTIRSWTHFTEHGGSGRTMSETLLAYSLGSLLCLALLPDTRWMMYLLVPVLVGINIFSAAFWVAAHRVMLNRVKGEFRAEYTNVWMVLTALAAAITPICAGALIDRFGLAGFRACFIVSGVSGLVFSAACRFTVLDGPIEPTLKRMLDPSMPLRMLGRILRVTLGLHPASRRK